MSIGNLPENVQRHFRQASHASSAGCSAYCLRAACLVDLHDQTKVYDFPGSAGIREALAAIEFQHGHGCPFSLVQHLV